MSIKFRSNSPYILHSGLAGAALLGFALQPGHAQPPSATTVAAPAVPAPPPATLPLGRTTYFVGESVPVALTAPGAAIQILDERAMVVARTPDKSSKAATGWRFDTTRLMPGMYSVWVNGTEWRKITLSGTQRSSPGAIFDEGTPSIPWQEANDPQKVAQWNERFEQGFRETEVAGFISLMQGDGRHYGELNDWARYGTMLWVNPYTRPLSFVGAMGWEPELEGMTHRMAQVAQMNARYPNFAGFAYHWDPVGYKRNMLLIYWGWGKHRAALAKYIGRSEKAIEDEFRKRTGLEPVSTADLIRYSSSIGHPEFGPAIDMPMTKWIAAISQHTAPMPAGEQAALEKRMAAWTGYLTGLMEESNAYHQKWLKQIEPSLTNTSSYDNQFTIREGSWQPRAYAPLDFRWVEAWSDQVDGPDYIYQWLFHAALAEMGRRPGQPVWVASVLSEAHAGAPYPGRFSRAVAHNLAYGGRGMGFPIEGFSNVMGGFNAQTQWWFMRDKPGAEDYRSGREWLYRFAPLEEQSTPVRRVGVLLSLTQFSRQNLGLGFDSPLYNTFIALSRLGYTPRFVSEEDIARDGLQGFGALVVINQTAQLPDVVMAGVRSFQTAGGKVFISKNSTATLPGAVTLDVAEPFKRPGKPFNIGVPNVAESHPSMLQETRFDELAPAFRSALGDALRTRLLPEGDERSRISTFGLNGGPDAHYVIATNDSFYRNQSSWARQEVMLRPNGAAGFGALYDVSEEKALGAVAPVKAGFMDRTARLYALLTRPVEKLDVRAGQSITAGESIHVSVAFLDKANMPLRAAIPFHVTLTPPGAAASGVQRFHRSTGQNGAFSMSIPTGANAVAGQWTLTVRSLLDGRSYRLPIQVRAGMASAMQEISEPVVARGDLTELWNSKPTLVAPIFDGPHKEAHLAAARAAQTALAGRGVKVEILENPTVTTYAVSYDPAPEQLAENARAERGETFGRISRLTDSDNDYFGVHGGFIYGRPVLLLDIADQKDNPLAESIANMVWPQVTSSFPGAGRATVQRVRSPFKLGMDAVVVQAADAAGLLAGARALARPSGDWITPGIQQARLKLHEQLSIGRLPSAAVNAGAPPKTAAAYAQEWKLTSKGLQSGSSPQPLALALGTDLPPLCAEAKAPPVTPRAIHDLPGQFPVAKAALPFMQIDGVWQPRVGPDGDWIGDLRFSEATYLKVRVPAGGRYNVRLGGTFRYSDRQPSTQASWEEVVALYMKTVQPKREPMRFDVLLDGKPLASLSDVKAEEREVTTEFSTDKPILRTVKEEVGVLVSGALDLPAGEHELLFVHNNIVDGRLQTIEVLPAG